MICSPPRSRRAASRHHQNVWRRLALDRRDAASRRLARAHAAGGGRPILRHRRRGGRFGSHTAAYGRGRTRPAQRRLAARARADHARLHSWRRQHRLPRRLAGGRRGAARGNRPRAPTAEARGRGPRCACASRRSATRSRTTTRCRARASSAASAARSGTRAAPRRGASPSSNWARSSTRSAPTRAPPAEASRSSSRSSCRRPRRPRRARRRQPPRRPSRASTSSPRRAPTSRRRRAPPPSCCRRTSSRSGARRSSSRCSRCAGRRGARAPTTSASRSSWPRRPERARLLEVAERLRLRRRVAPGVDADRPRERGWATHHITRSPRASPPSA